MSAILARSAARAVIRAAPRTRGYASAEWLEKEAAVNAHALETTALWRKVSFYVCVPGIIACALWVRQVEAEHAEHEHHAREENGGELVEPPAYEYLNRRGKPFPWGNNTLFFNPHVSSLGFSPSRSHNDHLLQKNKDLSQA
ncbi:hypothetical protein JAAARDRAFT_119615 [Jaapia argillacea MUCL 33604]|uniref:Cytochrome c oxidase subunit n=1 Tax=Jaapia argillacea MUCL 33604 TaxID=933084 RepID=A0A067Q983_9AGAM|nr:hypothetical protein JAAARDRAFT_119615 [Jaapia argillacea MUCL 33604]